MTIDTDDITEFEELGANKVSGVGRPANGTPWLLLKSTDVEADPTSPHTESPEADEQEDEMTKAEADEIEALLTKSGLWASYCGEDGCEVCEPQFAALGERAIKAKLKAKQRHALPDSAFAIPEERKYPIHDESHARNALARAGKHPQWVSRIKAAVRRRFPNIKVGGDKVKKSPGVPDESVAIPKAAGKITSGQSGLLGPMTAGIEVVEAAHSVGGKSPYRIPTEAKINDNRPAPADPPQAQKDWEIEVIEKQNWAVLGEPEQEDDSSVLGCLVAAYRAVRQTMMAQKVDPDNLTDPNDRQVWAHLEDAKSILQNAVTDQAMDIVDEGTMKADYSPQTLAAIRVARDNLNESLGEGNKEPSPGDVGGRASEEGDIMATITKEELVSFIAEQSAVAVKDIEKKKAKKEAKKAKKQKKAPFGGKKAPAFDGDGAEKNANNGGDITAEEEHSRVGAKRDANDVGSVGHSVEGQYINKEESKLLEKLDKIEKQVEKFARRPRSGGPVLDGQARGDGTSPASEARQSEAVTKSAEELNIERLAKSFEESKDPTERMQLGEALTLARLNEFNKQRLL